MTKLRISIDVLYACLSPSVLDMHMHTLFLDKLIRPRNNIGYGISHILVVTVLK